MKLFPSSSIILLVCPCLLAQGPLAPPAGPPAASMKTLDQIATLAEAGADARTIIGDPAGLYTISASGSYRLASNRVAPAGNVSIIVNAPDVVIDLNGFTISAGGVGARGIETNSGARRLTVRNGTITGCAGAIDGAGTPGAEILHIENVKAIDCSGVAFRVPANSLVSNCQIRGVAGTTTAVSAAANCEVRGVRVNLVNGYGISAGANSVVEGCSVHGATFHAIAAGAGARIDRCEVTGMTSTGNFYGISAGPGSSILNSIARGNVAIFGIYADDNSTIQGCVSSGNTSPSAISYGISAGDSSTVLNCTASGNLSTNAAPSQQGGAGFAISDTTVVRNCSASGNRGAGIWSQGKGAIISDNTLSNNGLGAGGVGAGIALGNVATRNRIEGNTAIGNRAGFLVLAGSIQNFFARNTAGGNVVNWTITSGNFVAPITSAVASPEINGSTGGTAFSSADPNANFSL